MMEQANKHLLSTYCIPDTAKWWEYTNKMCPVFKELELPWETVMLGDKLPHSMVRTAIEIWKPKMKKPIDTTTKKRETVGT